MDAGLQDTVDRLQYVVSRIETLGAGGELQRAGSLQERNALEAARLASHGRERQEFTSLCRELRQTLQKLGLL